MNQIDVSEALSEDGRASELIEVGRASELTKGSTDGKAVEQGMWPFVIRR